MHPPQWPAEKVFQLACPDALFHGMTLSPAFNRTRAPSAGRSTCRYGPTKILDGNFEQSMFLDVAGLHGNLCDVEDGIGRHLNRFKFGCVVSHPKPFEGTSQGVMNRFIP